MGTGRRSSTILLPEPSKIFELNVYLDNQIMRYIFIFCYLLIKVKPFVIATQYQNQYVNTIKSEKITFKFFFIKSNCSGLFQVSILNECSINVDHDHLCIAD